MVEILSKGDEGRTESEILIQRIVAAYRDKSERARRTRADLNKTNWDLYHGRQDWTHKTKYQSKEFLPDLPIAVEQISGVIERALGDFTDWFEIMPVTGGYDDPIQQLLLDPASLSKLLTHVLSRLWIPGNHPETAYNFPTLIADAVKLGILEAVITLKVYGVDAEEPRFRLERAVVGEGQTVHPAGYVITYPVMRDVVQQTVSKTFRLCIEAIPLEDFFPDPSGLDLYDIHEVTRSIFELKANGDYDPDVLDLLESKMLQNAEADHERRRRSGEDQTTEDWGLVRVRECWGDIIDKQSGEILEQNVLVTTVGDTYLLRPPTPNPFWHGKRPFVKAPLLRVPFSTVHKALLDHAGPMAKLMNEVMNLMIDGGLASVWGTRQIRPDLMEHPEEVSDGVPQAYTAVLKPHVPDGAKFIERVDEGGQVPQYAFEVFHRIERSFQSGLATPDLAMAQLPPRQVKATEIVEVMNARGGLFEAIIARLEDALITPTLELAWQVVWQHLGDFATPELVQILDPRRALILQRMSPAERFVRMAQSVKFRVSGLRAILGRARDYQKLVAFMQTLGVNPAMAAAFDQRYSITKLLAQLMKAISIDPTALEKAPGAGPEMPMQLLAGNAGTPSNRGQEGGEIEAAMAETNPEGERGVQTP